MPTLETTNVITLTSSSSAQTLTLTGATLDIPANPVPAGQTMTVRFLVCGDLPAVVDTVHCAGVKGTTAYEVRTNAQRNNTTFAFQVGSAPNWGTTVLAKQTVFMCSSLVSILDPDDWTPVPDGDRIISSNRVVGAHVTGFAKNFLVFGAKP